MENMHNNIKYEAEIDCVGLYCPMPIAKTKEGIETIKVGEVLKIEADDPAAEEDIKRFCKRTGHILLSFERLEDGTQRFLIKRRE